MMYLLAHTNTNEFIMLSPDDADLSKVMWTVDTQGYPVRRYGKERLKIHRIVAARILGTTLTSDILIDHKDGNKLNCQRNNLRVATYQQNMQNRKTHKNSRTGYKGIQTNGYSWYAAIKHNGERKYYGPYKTPLEAARVYDEKAKEFFGEFARLNNI